MKDLPQSPYKPSFGGLYPSNADSLSFRKIVLIGRKNVLTADLVESTMLRAAGATDVTIVPAIVASMLDSISSSSGMVSTFISPKEQLFLCVLPEKVSRHNHPLSISKVTDFAVKALTGGRAATSIVFVEHTIDVYIDALTSAVAKAMPVYSKKTSSSQEHQEDQQPVQVSFWDATSNSESTNYQPSHLHALLTRIQLAAQLMDMTPEELTTTEFSELCRNLFADDPASQKHVTFTEVIGDDLLKRGYGGIYGVGKGAREPPRLVQLDYNPPDAKETVALVGKGIVYDTGGLALKTKQGMCGMKHDMGGAAGMLGAFCVAVQRRVKKHVVLILCLAENAIGPDAFRNDDILTMYSGKTVEINNTDAEGRLVLGDGVAHATRHIEGLDLVIDMATLTGAQLVATGKTHASILATSEALEKRAMTAAMASGDLVYPVLYCPELLMKEFDSKVADMKNSVKDRGNAQTSCAGHFIEAHLNEAYEGSWLHIDMAGPGSKDERGTGYGVALVAALLESDP